MQEQEPKKAARVAPVLQFMQEKMASEPRPALASAQGGTKWAAVRDGVHSGLIKPMLPDPASTGLDSVADCADKARVQDKSQTPTKTPLLQEMRREQENLLTTLPARPASPGSSAPQTLSSQQLVSKCERRIEHSLALAQSFYQGVSGPVSTDARQARAKASLAAEEAQLCVSELKATLSHLRALRHVCQSTEDELKSLHNPQAGHTPTKGMPSLSTVVKSPAFKGLLPDIEHEDDTKLPPSDVHKELRAHEEAHSLYASTQSSASSAKALEHQLSVVKVKRQLADLALPHGLWLRCDALFLYANLRRTSKCFRWSSSS